MIKFLLLFMFSITAINAKVNSLCCIGEDINHEAMIKKNAQVDMKYCDHHEEKDSEKKSDHHCVLKCCSGALLFSSEINSEIIIFQVKLKSTYFYKVQKTKNYHIHILRPPIFA